MHVPDVRRVLVGRVVVGRVVVGRVLGLELPGDERSDDGAHVGHRTAACGHHAVAALGRGSRTPGSRRARWTPE